MHESSKIVELYVDAPAYMNIGGFMILMFFSI